MQNQFSQDSDEILESSPENTCCIETLVYEECLSLYIIIPAENLAKILYLEVLSRFCELHVEQRQVLCYGTFYSLIITNELPIDIDIRTMAPSFQNKYL